MYWLKRFFYGRRGIDQLTTAILLLCCLLSALGLIFRLPALSLVYYMLFALCIFRTLSRNLYRRGQENMRFMAVMGKIASAWRLRVRMAREWRTFRYLKCPGCKQRLRVPRGKGKISVTCAKCKMVFIKKV